MNHLKPRLNFLTSFNFFLLVILVTIIFFNFFDIYLFKESRNLNGTFFNFFEKVVNPISDIFDPLNIIILSILFYFIINSLKKTIKDPQKKMIILSKFSLSESKVNDSFQYYQLIIKHIVASLVFTGALCHVLKYIIGAARPKYFFYYQYDRLNYFNIEHKVNALPSGHTQAAFTVAILIYIYLNRYTLFVFMMAVLIALSRIFMSMHFPSDLILGALIGAFFPILIYKIFFLKRFEKFKKEKIIEFKTFVKFLCYKLYI